MKRLAVAIATLALGAGVIQAAPAQAGSGGITFSITSIQVDDYAIRSGGCRSIPIVATHDAPVLVDYVSADVEIWNGSRYVDEAFLTGDGPGRLEGSFHYCTFKGLGDFRLGPTEISWSGMTASDFLSGEIQSSKTTTFTILQDARVSKLKAKRSGKKITFTGKSSWYSVKSSKWLADPKGWKFKLQRQAPGGAWKTVKSARVGKKGFKVSTSRSASASYRIVTSAGKETWSGISKIVRK